jgi:hypothetical protein
MIEDRAGQMQLCITKEAIMGAKIYTQLERF